MTERFAWERVSRWYPCAVLRKAIDVIISVIAYARKLGFGIVKSSFKKWSLMGYGKTPLAPRRNKRAQTFIFKTETQSLEHSALGPRPWLE